MAYKPKPGQGALFRNDKDGNESRPDYRGNLVVYRDMREGETVDLAAWLREDRNGKKYLSIKAQDSRQEQRREEPPPEPQGGFDEIDPLPF